MKHASKYMDMNCADEAEEEFNDEEDLLDDDDDSVVMETDRRTDTRSIPSKKTNKKRVVRQANTNVLSAKLFTLASEVDIATGDPVFCKNCQAVFSSISKWKENGWTCEFCSFENEIEMEEEEAELLAGKASVDYILEAPPEKANSTSTSTNNDGAVIFCIDISGSMCVSTPVQGNVNIRGNQSLEKFKQGLVNDRDIHRNQYSGNEQRNVTYISRLQSVTTAVESQLTKLEKEHPNKKVGLVTFNREVTVIAEESKSGGAAQSDTVVTGDKLHNFDELLEVGKKIQLQQTIEKSSNALIKRLYQLEEAGPTALGPALIVSVGMCIAAAAASGSAAASQIVLCTDGKANVGVGSLDNLTTDESKSKTEEVYQRIGQVALEHGVNISVISIKGEDCRLEQLGALTDMTSGVVEQVDPLELTKNFADVLKVAVIATHVEIKLLLHKGLFVRDQNALSSNSTSSTSSNNNNEAKDGGAHSVTQTIGNVTAETEITFDYGVKPESAKDFKDQKLPFQLQVRYTRPNGMKCIRIISNTQDVTWNRQQAEADVDINILGKHAVVQASKTAQAGDYTGARLANRANMRLWKRTAKTEQQREQLKSWTPAAKKIETTLQTETLAERAEGMDLDSDSVDVKTRNENCKKRKGRRTDSSAAALYKFTRK